MNVVYTTTLDFNVALFSLFIEGCEYVCEYVDMRFLFASLYVTSPTFMFRLVFWINETCFYNILDRVFIFLPFFSFQNTPHHFIFLLKRSFSFFFCSFLFLISFKLFSFYAFGVHSFINITIVCVFSKHIQKIQNGVHAFPLYV